MKKQCFLSKTDYAAFVLLGSLFLCYFLFADRGIGYRDESLYYSIVQRVFQGDRMFVDEWHPIQTSSFLLFLPYRFAYLLCGGTEGIILTLRYLFLTYRTVFAMWVWYKLRPFGTAGLTGTILYFVFIHLNVCVFSYNTFSLDALLVICILLFLCERLTPIKCMAVGVLIGIIIISEPLFTLSFGFYCILVFLCAVSKKLRIRLSRTYQGLFSIKTVLWIMLGGVIIAVPFFCYMLHGSSLKLIITYVSDILEDPEYSIFSFQPISQTRIVLKWKRFLSFVGGYYAVLWLVLFVGVLVCNAIRSVRERKALKYSLFFCTCVLWMVVQIHLIRKIGKQESYFHFFYVPIGFFSFLFYLLCSTKKKHFLGFFVVGLLFSICVDSSSQVWLLLGGRIMQFCGCISCAELLTELKTDISPAVAGETVLRTKASVSYPVKRVFGGLHRFEAQIRKKKLCGASCYIVAAGLLFCGLFCAAFAFLAYHSFTPQMEQVGIANNSRAEIDSVIDIGPQKGIRTTSSIKISYEKILADLDEIKKDNAGPLYIFARYPDLYLYTEMDYACYSSWVSETSFERQVRYWVLFPERKPKYIYIPAVNYNAFQELSLAAKLEQIGSVCTYTMKIGKGGYIILPVTWNMNSVSVQFD